MVYCKRCESVAEPVEFKPGQSAIEIALWLLPFLGCLFLFLDTVMTISRYQRISASSTGLLVVGFLFVVAIAYSAWRSHATVFVCKACESEEIIPTNTPAGRAGAEAAREDRLKHYTPVLGLNDPR